MDALLSDPVRCAVHGRGARLLSPDPSGRRPPAQALNDLRVSAWERLGCPDFEAGDNREVTDDNFLCLWALQVTDLFLAPSSSPGSTGTRDGTRIRDGDGLGWSGCLISDCGSRIPPERGDGLIAVGGDLRRLDCCSATGAASFRGRRVPSPGGPRTPGRSSNWTASTYPEASGGRW